MKEHSIISSLPISVPASTKTFADAKVLKKEVKEETLNRVMIQPKFIVGAAKDPLEHEADTVADIVTHMPENVFIQRKCTRCEKVHKTQQRPTDPFIQKKEIPADNIIQRQEEDGLKLDDSFKLKTSEIQPDYLSLKTPFLERNALHLWNEKDAVNVWQYNYRFFKMTGLSDSMAGKAANITAPFAIDAQLKAGNPKLWEISDKESNTSSLVGSVPAFSFDANFKNWKFLPFLQNK